MFDFLPSTKKKKATDLQMVSYLQAQLVSTELIRVAILWHEMWHEALEEASRLYFGEHNIEGMLKVLEPLHVLLEEGAMKNNTTIKETTFIEVASVLVGDPELQIIIFERDQNKSLETFLNYTILSLWCDISPLLFNITPFLISGLSS